MNKALLNICQMRQALEFQDFVPHDGIPSPGRAFQIRPHPHPDTLLERTQPRRGPAADLKCLTDAERAAEQQSELPHFRIAGLERKVSRQERLPEKQSSSDAGFAVFSGKCPDRRRI